MGALVGRAASELREIAARRGIAAAVSPVRGEVPAAVEPELADRLLFRLFGALADPPKRGSGFRSPRSRRSVDRGSRSAGPKPFKGIADSELFEGRRGEAVEGGFSLRLARGLARIAGGDLVSSRDAFALLFPRP